MTPTADLVFQLVISNTISEEEADLLQLKLPGEIVPRTWRGVKEQIEDIINRKLS